MGINSKIMQLKQSHLINGVFIGTLVFAIFITIMTASSISEIQALPKEVGKKPKFPSCTDTGTSKCCLYPDKMVCGPSDEPQAPIVLPPPKK